MEIITSVHNPIVKKLTRLMKYRRQREALGWAIFDGVSLAGDYLRTGGQLELILFDQEQLARPAIEELRQLSKDARQLVLTSAVFSKISQVKTSPGVVCVVKVRARASKDFTPTQQSIILLDAIQNPGNLGTILRSCLAFGVQDIFLSATSVDAFSPKVIRSSMGACFGVNIYQNTSLSEMAALVRSTHQIIATSPRADKVITEIKLGRPVAWLFGNEAVGLSEESLRLADEVATIPQSKQIESLNLAAAVAICLYEQTRQSQFGS